MVSHSPRILCGILCGILFLAFASALFASETSLNNFGAIPSFNITSPSDGQCFAYSASTQSWVNSSSCGASGGTITLTTPSWMTITGSPCTPSCTLGLSATTGLAANQFLATPNGSTGALATRSIVAPDLSFSGVNSPQGLSNGYSNLTAQNTQNIRACLARIRSKTGTCKVAVIGDSTIGGYDSASIGSGIVGGRALSTPSQLAALLTARGLPAQVDNVFGNNNVGNAAAYTSYNPAVTLTNWPVDAATTAPSLGDWSFKSTTNGATFAFTPVTAFDTIDFYVLRATGNGSFTVNVDGGSTLATVSTAGFPNYIKQIVTGITLGTHTINLTTTSATATYLNGIAVHASTAPAIEIYNMGVNSQTAGGYASTTGSWYPIVALPVVAPNLTIIDLSVNDINNSASPAVPATVATYSTNIQSLITAGLTTGDVVLVVGNPSSAANQTNGVAAAYTAALYALAVSNNIPILDIPLRWVSYVAANTVMPYYDNSSPKLHPGAPGYGDIASALGLLLQ